MRQIMAETELDQGAKLLWIKIWQLSHNKNKSCYAGNSSLSKMLATTPGTISRWISQLERAGYVRRELNRASGYRDRKLYAIAPIRMDQQTPILMDEASSDDIEEEGLLSETDSLPDAEGEALSMYDEQSNGLKNRKNTQNLDSRGSKAPSPDDADHVHWTESKAEAESIIQNASNAGDLSIEQRSNILLWLFSELRGRWILNTGKVSNKFAAALKTMPFENIAEAMWICEHNKYFMAETERKQTKWTLTWLLKENEIHIDDVINSEKVNIEPSKRHMEIRKNIQHLVPNEYLKLPENSKYEDGNVG